VLSAPDLGWVRDKEITPEELMQMRFGTPDGFEAPEQPSAGGEVLE
jgi:hypothetical protein